MADENKPFNYDLIVAKYGKINGLIFENDYVKIPMTLFYTIEVELADFKIDDEVINTSFVLDFIDFKVKDLQEIEHQTFSFSVYPQTGYIDASVYILWTHHPVSVSKITFGKLDDGFISVSIDYNIEYLHSNVQDLAFRTLNTILELDKLSIDPQILEPTQDNLANAIELMAKFYNVRKLEAPRISRNEFDVKTIVFDIK